jgi:WD40 repeat protein
MRMGGHLGDVNAAAISPEGDLIFSAGNDNTVRAWSAQTGSPLAELKAGAGEFLALALRPGTRELAVAGRDSLVRVFAYKVE